MAANENALFYQRVLGAAGLAIIAYLVFKIIEPFLGPIAWALFLGFLLQPAQARADECCAAARRSLHSR